MLWSGGMRVGSAVGSCANEGRLGEGVMMVVMVVVYRAAVGMTGLRARMVVQAVMGGCMTDFGPLWRRRVCVG